MSLSNEAKHYLNYLNKHIQCVNLAYEKLKEIIPDLFEGYDEEVILKTEQNIKCHDSMKFEPHNLQIYGEHFLNIADEEEYNKVIHQHIMTCPHHFQHWLVFYTMEKIYALEMSYDYIIEMICDWYSFSFFKNDETEIVRWYKKSRDRMIFAPKTLAIIDKIIDRLEKYFIEKGLL